MQALDETLQAEPEIDGNNARLFLTVNNKRVEGTGPIVSEIVESILDACKGIKGVVRQDRPTDKPFRPDAAIQCPKDKIAEVKAAIAAKLKQLRGEVDVATETPSEMAGHHPEKSRGIE